MYFLSCPSLQMPAGSAVMMGPFGDLSIRTMIVSSADRLPLASEVTP